MTTKELIDYAIKMGRTGCSIEQGKFMNGFNTPKKRVKIKIVDYTKHFGDCYFVETYNDKVIADGFDKKEAIKNCLRYMYVKDVLNKCDTK